MNEFLLVKEAGFEPLGLVVGSSIYHIGFQQSAWNQNQEMAVLSQAMYQARELAMTRMEEEADQLGADGVVGVRLDIGRYEWGENMAEFIAIGTAVKHREGKLHRAPNGRPFTSDLSGQDFWTLLHAGYRPVGLMMGSCVYHVAHQGIRQAFRQMGQNVEMQNYTQALYDARELAMERMQYEAQQVQAEGSWGWSCRSDHRGPTTRSPRLTAARREDERVTPLELFFDLVFVLAITQCTALMAHPTWKGLGAGACWCSGMLWWSWVGYAWLTSVVDPEEGGVRLAMFAAMAALLVAALCVPRAFGNTGLEFACAYGVRAGRPHRAVHRGEPRRPVRLRRSVTGLAGSTAIGVGLLVAASFTDGASRAACGRLRWCSTWAGRCSSAPTAGSSCPATSPSATA